MSSEGWRPRAPEGTADTLRRLEERLDRASAAAERLMAEAAERTDDSPPPSGWQAPESDGGARRDSDLEALLTLARSLRDLVPADLQQRLITALRELLQAVRDLVDWYVERLDRERAEPAQVQDIPIL